MACNMAVTLAQEYKEDGTGGLDLTAGDVAVMLNINAKNTIAEMVQEQENLDSQLVEELSCTSPFRSTNSGGTSKPRNKLSW